MSPPSDCRLENPKVQRAHNSSEDAQQELANPLIVKLKLLYNNAASQVPTDRERGNFFGLREKKLGCDFLSRWRFFTPQGFV
jgi:hypothetical protein